VVTIDPALLADGRVQVVPARTQPLGGLILASGQIVAEPTGAASITAPVNARVLSIAVRLGDSVARGDVLAVLEAGEVARVAADLEQARARLEHAQRVADQEQALMQRGATSLREYSNASSELARARADVNVASALLEGYGAKGGRRLALRAPIAGDVVRVDGAVGASVDPTTPLFRLVDTAALSVRADVPESEADLVPERAVATIQSLSQATSCRGMVESHAPAVDLATRTVPFRVRFSAECGPFHEGAFVDVAIERSSAEGERLIALPRDAVTSINEVPLVFVRGPAEGTFLPRSVRIARSTGPLVFLSEGVREGEQVVDRGVILLKGELMRAELE
jgi:cobalt-zinc-cadmium efflux system membrane fusion protein